MAKKKVGQEGVNRSQSIRDILAKNPKTPSRDIVATLGEKGIKVKLSLVYAIKVQLKRKKRRQIGKSMAEAGITNPVDLILQVRSLAGEAGGMRKLKQLVDAFAE